jgi:hypothetical protein
MSLGDGLAKAMIKYQHAKKEYGLKSLLLGQTDLAIGEKNDMITEKEVFQDLTDSKAGQTPRENAQNQLAAFKLKCPACDGVLCFSEGCVKCYGCGFSQC